LLQRLQTPTTGVIVGALLILIGGIVTVSGASSPGTILAIAGFALILRFRVLPARRNRGK
jgi:multisubunit Na+/H+ antiporter MnhG subunit